VNTKLTPSFQIKQKNYGIGQLKFEANQRKFSLYFTCNILGSIPSMPPPIKPELVFAVRSSATPPLVLRKDRPTNLLP
jgi:hypothetical protein